MLDHQRPPQNLKKKLFERGILVADGNRYTHINYVYMMREVKETV